MVIGPAIDTGPNQNQLNTMRAPTWTLAGRVAHMPAGHHPERMQVAGGGGVAGSILNQEERQEPWGKSA